MQYNNRKNKISCHKLIKTDTCIELFERIVKSNKNELFCYNAPEN
jgi:hypothetical protein